MNTVIRKAMCYGSRHVPWQSENVHQMKQHYALTASIVTITFLTSDMFVQLSFFTNTTKTNTLQLQS